MPTNEERRIVAARLRNAAIEDIGIYGYSAHLGEAIGECVRLVSGHECLVERGLNRLADLIEPEHERTCRNVAEQGVLFECSECGAKTVDAVGNYTQEYCAACGAKVING